MIGKKTASAIRAELLQQCAKSGIDPQVWFDEQIRKLESGASPSQQEIETLRLIRDGLQAEPRRQKRPGQAVQTRSSKAKRRKTG